MDLFFVLNIYTVTFVNLAFSPLQKVNFKTMKSGRSLKALEFEVSSKEIRKTTLSVNKLNNYAAAFVANLLLTGY